MEYKFEKPYEFEGKIYEKLDIDLDRINGMVLTKSRKKLTDAKLFSLIPTSDPAFYAFILAEICSLPIEFFSLMPGRDFLKITAAVSNFLAD